MRTIRRYLAASITGAMLVLLGATVNAQPASAYTGGMLNSYNSAASIFVYERADWPSKSTYTRVYPNTWASSRGVVDPYGIWVAANWHVNMYHLVATTESGKGWVFWRTVSGGPKGYWAELWHGADNLEGYFAGA